MSVAVSSARVRAIARLPAQWDRIINLLNSIDAPTMYFSSEGDKTVGGALNEHRTILVEVTAPKFLPDGIWEVDVKALGDALRRGRGGRLEVVGDKIVYVDDAGNSTEVGRRSHREMIPQLNENIFTATAVIDTDILRAALRTGRERKVKVNNLFAPTNIVGFRMTPEGLMIGVWDGDGGVAVKVPESYVASTEGTGTIYVNQHHLSKILLPGVRSVKLRWGDGDKAPLEISYNLGDMRLRIWVAEEIVEEVKREYSPSWETAPPNAKLVGWVNREDFEILRKAEHGILFHGTYFGLLDYPYNRTAYCKKTSIDLPGVWRILAPPRMDLVFAVMGGKAPLYATPDGTLYIGGWEIGEKDEKIKKIICPSVVGPPLPPAVVETMRKAWITEFQKDGIYVMPHGGVQPIQIAKASLSSLDPGFPPSVNRIELSKLSSNTWRLGVTKEGIVVIDAGDEKIIAV